MDFSERIGSPGLGTTPMVLSREPLATEGEATAGADDVVDYDDISSATFGDGPAPALDLDLDGDIDIEPPAFGLPSFDIGGEW